MGSNPIARSNTAFAWGGAPGATTPEGTAAAIAGWVFGSQGLWAPRSPQGPRWRRTAPRAATRYGLVAQLGERLHGMQEVVGSIPTRSTNPCPVERWQAFQGTRFQRQRRIGSLAQR